MRFYLFLAGMLLAGPLALAESLTVQPTSVTDSIAVAASVEGKEMAEARARISGTLDNVLVVRGQWVKKGQVLGVVRDKKLGQQAEGLKVQLDAAEKNVERLKRLLPLQAVSKAAVDQAEAQAAALRAQLQNTGQNTADGRILAPFEGQFVALRAVSGTVMMPGESMGTVAAMPLTLKLALPERHAAYMAVGQEIPLTDDKGEPMGVAKVGTVYPQVAGGRVTVEASLPETSGTLLVGSKVKAFVPTGMRQAIVIPRDYLRVQNGLTYVKVDKLGDTLVQAGYPQPDGRVEILSGLKAGDVVLKP